MENNKGCLLSWPAIVVGFILFWPVGLALLIFRLRQDRKLLLNAGRLMTFVGYALGVLIIFGIIGTYQNGDLDGGTITVFVFLVLAAVALVFFGRKFRRMGSVFKEYIELIVNQEVRKIEMICERTGKSYTEVYNDVEEMIEKGYFKRAYINDRHEIIFGIKEGEKTILDEIEDMFDEPGRVLDEMEGASEAPAQKRMTVVKCKGCGANNEVVVDRVSECEYCGSKIQG
ncbi:MAG: DUF2852 domain-containing protein [Firmicutes bacterium]|jgi:hypothetical protein|nr:DUF2852 domain-containing protein [Bacillota bacterium]